MTSDNSITSDAAPQTVQNGIAPTNLQPITSLSDQITWRTQRAAGDLPSQFPQDLSFRNVAGADHNAGTQPLDQQLKQSIAGIKPGDTGNVTINVDGDERQFQLHVPKGFDPAKPAPLMIMYHGLSQDDKSIQQVTGMNDEADKNGFLVAYPQAKGPIDTFNIGESVFGGGHDDVKFTNALIDTLHTAMNTDPKRVYLAGFSTGGAMAQKAATELSGKVAAVADVEGWTTGKEAKPASPVSSLTIHGTDDLVVPTAGSDQNTATTILSALVPGFDIGREIHNNPESIDSLEQDASNVVHGDNIFGSLWSGMKDVAHIANRAAVDTITNPLSLLGSAYQLSPDGAYIEPTAHTVDMWRQADGAGGKPTVTNGIDTTSDDYQGSNGNEVKLLTINGGEHAWSGSPTGLPLVGEPNQLSASDTVVSFLLGHQKKA